MRERKPVARAQSVPHRRPGNTKPTLKRQASSEALQTPDPEEEEKENPRITHPESVQVQVPRGFVSLVSVHNTEINTCYMYHSLITTDREWRKSCTNLVSESQHQTSTCDRSLDHRQQRVK